MSQGPINYTTACIKTLSAVEAETPRSNQHEFNGVVQLKALFGLAKIEMEASFSIRGSSESYTSKLTWYDAREAHPKRSEHRLYFQTNPVMSHATEGGNIVIGFDKSGNIHCELIPQVAPGHTNISGWQPVALTP